MLRYLVPVAVVSLTIAPQAQQRSDMAPLLGLVKPGQVVRVTDDLGQETTGRVSGITPATLDIVSAGVPQRVPLDRIVLIRHPHDGLANGAWTGFAIGAGLGVLASTVGTDCDEGSWFCPSGSRYVVTSTLLVGGIGAALGAAVDAIVKRDPVIYRRAPRSHVHIVPAVGRGNTGVVVAVRW